MRTDSSPSLQESDGRMICRPISTYQSIVNNYLKDIRNELLEEEKNNEQSPNNEIIFIKAQLQGVSTEIMIDTGANISLIDNTEFDRINGLCKEQIPTLPVNNIVIVGATGKLNKTIRKQTLIEVSSNGNSILMVFLVAKGLPFSALIGCDMLRRHSAVIDMGRGIVTLYHEQGEWSSEIVGRKCATHYRQTFTLVQNREENIGTFDESLASSIEGLWNEKIKEIEDFSIHVGLTRNQREELIRIYNKNKRVFSDLPGKARNFICKLEFRDNISFNRKSYPIAQSLRGAVRKEIQRMLEQDIIEPSSSPYTSPIVAVKKKDGTVRLCLDAREINKSIINDRTSPGEIEEIMKRFDGVKYMSIWDAVCGYWQIELHPNSRPYVAFIIEGRNYQFKRLPFGLVNSVAIFIKCMDGILGKEVLEYTTVYVDDLLITSSNWEEHCQRVETVLSKLAENNITLKLDKSKLITNKLQFLGFVLNEKGITTSPEKVEVIQNFPKPKNIRQLQSFLGVCNYYRKFQKNHSNLTSRFKHLLSTKNKWRWTEEDDQTFKMIKDKFLESIMLHHPNFNRRFFINCDASNISLGAELYQEDSDGEHLVISFASRTLTNSERNYSVTEKELLSVVFACNKFRTYILGYPTTVRSDHKSISFLQKCKLNHGRITRWILALQEYNISWEYVPGKQNTVADVLSRVNVEGGTLDVEKEDIGRIYNTLVTRQGLTDILNKVKEEQQNDDKLTKIKQRLQSEDPGITPHYQLYNNLIFTTPNINGNHWKLYIPKSLEIPLIQNYHQLYGHMGPEKVVKALEEHVYIKGINKKVRLAVRTCKICQMVKVNNERKEGTIITVTTVRKFEKVFLDICGPFPRSGGRRHYRYIVIIWDHFTKYTKLYPISRASTQVIIKVVVEKYMIDVGTPESIVTDHGTQFKGKKWKNEMRNQGIKTYKTSIYHPSSNPAERVLREVGRILRTYCHDEHKRWSEVLPEAETFLNLAYHDTLGVTPHQMMFSSPPPREIIKLIKFPEELNENLDIARIYNRVLHKAELRRKRQERTIRKPVSYKVGEKVLIKNRQLPSSSEGIAKKLLLLYTGPYIVQRNNGNNTYLIVNPRNHKTKGNFNQTELKKFYE